MNAKPEMLLFDGSSILVRAYFASAVRMPPQKSVSGRFLNGVSGFLRMMSYAILHYKPSYVFVAWDISRDTFRREMYADYKGTRGELPYELLEQFDTTQEVLQILGVKQFAHVRYEADDLLGSMAALAEGANVPSMILTGDKDALQLVSEHTTVGIMKKGMQEIDEYTLEALDAVYGLTPVQFVDWKALVGDKSDNIPGVPGIGDKTASKLLKEHGTLEALLNLPESLSPSIRNKLVLHREQAQLSQTLAQIVCDVPLPFTAPECSLVPVEAHQLTALADMGLSGNVQLQCTKWTQIGIA